MLPPSSLSFVDFNPKAIDDDDVPDVIEVVDHDEKPGDDVVDQTLATKADDQRQDPEACDDGGDVDAPSREGDGDGDEDHDVADQAADQGADRFAAFSLPSEKPDDEVG